MSAGQSTNGGTKEALVDGAPDTEIVNERGDVWVPRRQSAIWRRRAEQGKPITMSAKQFIALTRTLDLCHAHQDGQRLAIQELARRDCRRASTVRRIMRRRLALGDKVQVAKLQVAELTACLRAAVAFVPSDMVDRRWLRALRIAEEGKRP